MSLSSKSTLCRSIGLLSILLGIGLKSLATYPSYYSHFYKGFVVVAGQKDTIRGYILLQPSLYRDSLSFDRSYAGYSDCIIVRPTESTELSIRPLIIRKEQISFVRLYYNVLFPRPADTTEVWSLNYAFGVTSYERRQKMIESGVIKECFTDFTSFPFRNKTLFLRLVNSGKVSVYDDFLNPEKCITNGYQLDYFLTPIYSSVFSRNRIFILDENKIEEIPTHASFSCNFQRTRSVLKYLNKRYRTRVKKRAFYSNRQMFAYISEHG